MALSAVAECQAAEVRAVIGNLKKKQAEKFSPIVQAIAEAERGTTGEIRVHLTQRWFERDPLERAGRLFKEYGMFRTTHRNGVLLYVNLRRHKFAVVGDEGIHKVVGQRYWEQLARNLRSNLQGTDAERAVAMAVEELGKVLHKYFPADTMAENPNQLPDIVSED